MTAALPYPTELERQAEWLGLSDNLQSLTDRLGAELSAALLRVGAGFVESDRRRDDYAWSIGMLLDEAEAEWSGDREEFWEAASELLRTVSAQRSVFATNTLRYYVRTVRGCARLIDRDRYRAHLQFAFFAAAVQIANDPRYVCNDVQAPLEWAVVQTMSGNAPTVEQMKAAFLRPEHQPDAGKTFTANFSQAMKSFDGLPSNVQNEIRDAVKTIRAAIERLERPTP